MWGKRQPQPSTRLSMKDRRSDSDHATTRASTSSPCVPSDRGERYGTEGRASPEARLTAERFRLGDGSKRWENRRGTHPAAPHARSDQEKDGRRLERYPLTATQELTLVGCRVGQDEGRWKQHAYYKRTDESQTRRHATPLRLLQLPRLAKDQGLWTVVAQEMRRRPDQVWLVVHASGEHLQIGCAVGGKRTRGPDATIESRRPVKPHAAIHQPPRTLSRPSADNQSCQSLCRWPADDLHGAAHFQGSLAEPLISSVWTRMGPSEHHPSLSGLRACCTPSGFGSLVRTMPSWQMGFEQDAHPWSLAIERSRSRARRRHRTES